MAKNALALEDLFFGDTVSAHFHDTTGHRGTGLFDEQVLGEIPSHFLLNEAHKLLAGNLSLLVLKPTLENDFDELTEFVGLGNTELLEEIIIELGELDFLDFFNGEFSFDGDSLQILQVLVPHEVDVDGNSIAHRFAFNLIAKFVGNAVFESKLLVDDECRIFQLADFAITMFDRAGDCDTIANCDGAGFVYRQPIGGENALFFFGDFFGSVGVDGLFELEAFVFRQLKLWTNLNLEFINEFALFRDVDPAGI